MVLNERAEVLLLWRHRFITNTWAYEIPTGQINLGEESAAAAAREFEEETGWRCGTLQPLVYLQPSNGLMTSEHYVFLGEGASLIGPAAEGSSPRALSGYRYGGFHRWSPSVEYWVAHRSRRCSTHSHLDHSSAAESR
ncbi:NUDIX domain-containing protein [Catellatospora sp. IY07-71]|uniref:NUDIX domain-containing protein n=1 Tax=Catellatospora sp. IY07-71 TaxID=2728827 RepID=UPI001BB46133|nr:NUDIX domain-containing protein [Catellatospora sp. IY07-71]